MCHYLSLLENTGYKLYADLENFVNPAELFRSLRPDIALLKKDHLIAIELTCCFETNFSKSRNYKTDRYKNLQLDCRKPVKLTKVFVEISSLGLHYKHIKDLKQICKENTNINVNRMINKMTEVAARASYFIYTRRNTEWPSPQILKFY